MTRTSGPRYPPQSWKGSWRRLSEEKKHLLQTKVSSCPVSVDSPTFCLVAIFKDESKQLELEVEQKKNRHPCIYRRTCKIHKEKNQLKCQDRTWKWMAIPGVWRKSMLHDYGCVFCSISLLSVYMCVRIPLSSRSIAGVPSSRALPHFPPLTTCKMVKINIPLRVTFSKNKSSELEGLF